MDVYGLMLKDGNLDSDFVVERNDGHSTTYSFREWLGEEPHIAEWEKEIFNHLHQGSVLDVGCGTGKHVAYLKSLGFDAHGIDASEGAIRIGQEYGRNIDRTDFWQLQSDKKFHNIIIMDSTIGFITHPARIDEFFKKVKEITHPQARLALTSIDWSKATNPTYQKYVANNKKQNLYPGLVKLRFKIGEQIGEWFEGHYYDMDSLLKCAIQNDFYPRWIGYENGIKYTLILENRTGEEFSF